MREYDLIADWYPTDRSRTFGVAEALAVAADACDIKTMSVVEIIAREKVDR